MTIERRQEQKTGNELMAVFRRGFAFIIIILLMATSIQMVMSSTIDDFESRGRDVQRRPNGYLNRDYAPPDAKNITFYLHNTTSPTGELGEYQVLNTTYPTLPANLTSNQRLNEDWAIFPPLQKDVVFNGTGEIKLWLSAAPNSAPNELYIEVTEVDGTNSVVQTLVPQTSPAPIPTLTATPQEVSIPFDEPSATMSQGNYLRIYFYLMGDGTTDYTIHWGPTYPSHMNVSLENHLDVATAMTYNNTLVPMTGFPAGVGNKTIYIRGNVTDPFGGYDIKWANVTIRGPGGTELVSNQSMELIEGYYNTYTSTFQYQWNYSGEPSGFYNVTIYAVDNTGYHYRYTYGHPLDETYGAHLAWKNVSFSVGLEYFANLRILDSTGVPLDNATVYTTDFGYMISNKTNSSGETNISVPGGSVTIKVNWQEVLVGNLILNVIENITYANIETILVNVFYPSLNVTDNLGNPLDNASLFITHPNGSYNIDPHKTNGSGGFYMGRTAGGDYEIIVKWRDVDVNTTMVTIDGNKTFVINTSVYHFTIYARDSGGNGLSGAQVVISNSSSNIVFDSKISDLNGMTLSILPGGDFDISIYWRETQVYLNTDYYLGDDDVLYAVCDIFSVQITVEDVRSMPVIGAQVVIKTAGGMVLDSSVTDLNGQVTSSLPAGTHTITVYWHETRVYYSNSFVITDDSPQTLTCNIFYLNITALDKHPSSPRPLEDAEIIIYDGSGNVEDRQLTDDTGVVESKLPVGSYDIEIRWKGVSVNYTSGYILDLGSQVVQINCDVFYLEINATDNRIIGLDNATVTAVLSSQENILGSEKTDSQGKTSFRLPSSQYNITISWLDIQVGEVLSYSLDGNDQLSVVCSVYYIDITVLDTHDIIVERARIEITSEEGRTFDLGQSNENGNFTARLPSTQIDIWVYWQGHLVNHTGGLNLDLALAESGLIVYCDVYYLAIELRDSDNISVENAVVALRDFSGQYISTNNSDAGGITMFKAPTGNFSIEVSWEGVVVAYIEDYYIGDALDPVIEINCSIYYLSLKAVDHDGYSLNDGTVTVNLNTTGKLMFSGVTDTTGLVTARLPGAGYNIFVRWKDIRVYDSYNYTLHDESDEELQASCSVYYLTLSLIDSKGTAVTDASVTVNHGSSPNTFDSGVTNEVGNVTFRLPGTVLDITVTWKSVMVNRTLGYELTQNVGIEMLCSIHYLELNALDSKEDDVLPYAYYSIYLRKGEMISSKGADIQGKAVIRLPGESYLIDVSWQDILVLDDHPYNLTDNDEINLTCQVYYLTLDLSDMADEPVKGAEVRLNVNETGQLLGSGSSDEEGKVDMRLPLGAYDITILWQGLEVHQSTFYEVSDNSLLEITCKIYYVEFKAVDSQSQPLAGARIFVQSTATGHLLGSISTDVSGNGEARLPVGTHLVDIYWQDTLIYKDEGYEVKGDTANLQVTYDCQVYYLSLKITDDRDVNVVDGVISISRAVSGIICGKCISDSNGSSTYRLPTGIYDLNVVWQGVTVNSTSDYELISDSELTLEAWIYYLQVNAIDDKDVPVANAEVTMTRTESGKVYVAGATDGEGWLQARLPTGNYDIRTRWRDTIVYSDTGYGITSSHELNMDCRIYYLTILVKDKEGNKLKDVYIAINSAGDEIMVSNYTDKNGKTMFRLPANTYVINASYKSTYQMSRVDLDESTTEDLDESTTLELEFEDYPPAIYTTNMFYWILLLAIILIVIFVISWLLAKKRREKSAEEEGADVGEISEFEPVKEDEIPEFEPAEEEEIPEFEETAGEEDLDEIPEEIGEELEEMDEIEEKLLDEVPEDIETEIEEPDIIDKK